MNETAKQLCAQLIQEAQTVIKCMENTESAVKCGEKSSLETVQLFNDLAADGVEHCQKIVLALSDLFYQPEENEGGKQE